MIRVLTAFFLVGLSWNDIAALPPFPNLSLFLTVLLFLVVTAFSFVHLSSTKQLFVRLDKSVFIGLLLLPLLGIVTATLSPYFSSGRLVLYFLPLLIFFTFALILSISRVTVEWVLRVLAIGFFLTMTVISLEFFVRFFLSIEILSFLPRTGGELRATAGLGDTRILRGAGFSSEPTIVAFYINSIAPISFYMLFSERNSVLLKISGVIVTLVASMSTFSPAFVALALSALIVFLIKLSKFKARITRSGVKVAALVVIFIIMITVLVPEEFFLRNINALISYTSGFETGGTLRSERLADAFMIFISAEELRLILLGHGVGYFNSSEWELMHLSSPNNFYIVLLLELGVIGLLTYLSTVFIVVRRLLRYETAKSTFLAIGLIAGSIHVFVISVFFQPFFLLLFFLGSTLLEQRGATRSMMSRGIKL